MTMNFLDFFSEIPDPRVKRCRRHELLDIIFLSVCAVLSGAQGWEAIEEFGEAKLEWLRKFVQLANGIPTHDTIARVMSRVNPEALQRCFLNWIQAVVQIHGGEVVAIDGKTLRGSFDTARRVNPLHMVSAWCCEHGLILGQVRTAEKSNEIKAIPELLELLDLRGAVVTIDAMGCQKEIAAKIREKRGDYVLAVKKNQGLLLEEIREAWELNEMEGCDRLRVGYFETVEEGHGRVEIRRVWQSSQMSWVPSGKSWKGAKSFAKVESERHVDGKITKEIRYFVSSLGLDPERFLRVVRSHWMVENQLHWVLDVTFKEDASRIRRGDAPENLSMLRRLVLNICRRNRTGKSNPSKIRRAAWNDDVRLELLLGAGLQDPPGAGQPDAPN